LASGVLVADQALVWTIAQADALIASGLAAGTFGPGAVPVIISDSAANIETLTVAQIGGLGVTGGLVAADDLAHRRARYRQCANDLKVWTLRRVPRLHP
jgi:hypothetical protein